MKNLLIATIIGGILTAAGLVAAPQRGWANLLLSSYYLLGTGLAAGVFISFLYVSNAGWGTAIRRVPEAMLMVVPIAGILMIVVTFGMHSLYEWSHPAVVVQDKILQSKSTWLNVPFFIGRTVFFLTVWIILAQAIVRTSLKQDETGDVSLTGKNKAYSSLFLVVYGITFSLASMDWIMSLEPHWYSTIFGIYNFSGAFLNALATITVFVIFLRRMGPLRSIVTGEHLHNLGKLIFGFSTFWMYIWFSQYLLLWYANIPEEVSFLVHRQQGSWLIFTVVNVLFNWGIPFVVLLPKWTKQNEGILFKVCIIVMIGHWIDLFWMILPPFMQQSPVVNVWEIAPFGGMIALFFYVVFRFLGQNDLIPSKDPMLIESLQHHQS